MMSFKVVLACTLLAAVSGQTDTDTFSEFISEKNTGMDADGENSGTGAGAAAGAKAVAATANSGGQVAAAGTKAVAATANSGGGQVAAAGTKAVAATENSGGQVAAAGTKAVAATANSRGGQVAAAGTKAVAATANSGGGQIAAAGTKAVAATANSRGGQVAANDLPESAGAGNSVYSAGASTPQHFGTPDTGKVMSTEIEKIKKVTVAQDHGKPKDTQNDRSHLVNKGNSLGRVGSCEYSIPRTNWCGPLRRISTGFWNSLFSQNRYGGWSPQYSSPCSSPNGCY